MKKKSLTLKLTCYTIKGVSDLTHWGGGNACIEMKPFDIKSIDKKSLLSNINDNGFGVESVNGAICDIYENFQGTLRFLKTLTVGGVSEYVKEHYRGVIYNET